MTINAVLIANRGEIAVRIARTCRDLGVRSIAIYPDVDASGLHVAAADEAIALGSDPRAYLDVAKVIEAAQRSGADAIHPGYGFLSENAALARGCEDAGIIFIGPSPTVIEAMGSKISAKAIAVDAGVPVVPGRAEPGLTDDDIRLAAEQIGLPVLLKASAGGGGKGMRVINDLAEIPDAVASARREAVAAFGDDALMLEKFVADPRHIEVQILGDAHGTVRALADRECSLQRRHQKVIEEAPATSIPEGVRDRMAADAVRIAEAVGYVGAGTVEFIVDGVDASQYYFLEMNTRLQVEHPVTEIVTDLDLVAWQIAVAEGRSVAELDGRTTGVAVEARLYAEDPANGFLPTGGTVLRWQFPTDQVRVDSGVAVGVEVGSNYDPLLAKVIATGADRTAAYRALARGLGRSTVLGLTTNLGYLARLAADERVLRNDVHTRWIDGQAALAVPDPIPVIGLVAAGLDRWLAHEDGQPADLWDRPSGWRMGEYGWAGWRFRTGDGPRDVLLRSAPADGALEVRVVGGDADEERLVVRAHRDAGAIVIADQQRSQRVEVLHDGARAWVGIQGQTWPLEELSRLAADRADEAGSALAPVRSPMPGTVIAVTVSAGDAVALGDPLVTVEAMKMEHTLRAPAAGSVAGVLVAVGDRVALEQDLVRWEAEDA